jgi:polysaccharide deacetylase family protein (PEP-CTERM system associated)
MPLSLNILSFDIEEWFMSYDSSQIPVSKWHSLPPRIEQNMEDILFFLEQANLKATFYIMGWIAEHYPHTVENIASAGHEIGYHSYYHELPANQGPEKFEDDLIRGLDILQSITNQPITLYRAPRFSLGCQSAFTIPILHKHGIRISSSTMSGRSCNNINLPTHPFIFEVNGIQLPEIPLNRKTTLGIQWVYTGSGYFRILPFCLIRKLYSQSPYNMAYFHPRDFDPHVPKTNLLPFYRNIMSNLGNTTTIPKLRQLIPHTHFLTISQAWQTWQSHHSTHHPIPIIKL